MVKHYQDVVAKIKQKISDIPTEADEVDGLIDILKTTEDLNENLIEQLPEILREYPLPRQTFNGQDFSQFPLTLLNHEGFNLDLYFWNNANTSIHDHNFSGAFKVLKGIYFQSTFRFEEIPPKTDWVSQGELIKIKSEKLMAGDVVGIKRGSDFIHYTHHLEGECVTACLRTEARTGPIHSFFPPSLKFKSVPFNLKEIKMLDYIRFLALNLSEKRETIRALMGDFSSSSVCQIVFAYNIPEWLNRNELREVALDVLKDRHQKDSWFKEIVPCLEKQKIMNMKLGYLMG